MPSHKLQKRQVQQQKILKKNLKDDLLKWICEKHATNSPLDRKLLRKKALQISESLELINFKCSEQWMTTFLKSYGFSTTLTSCEGPYFKDYRLWIDLMRPVLTQYKYKDIYHVDELTMYSDVCPSRTKSSNSQEDAQEPQVINATSLISILLCSNSSGTDKLPPLISGPYKSNICREDCKYYYNEDSCISDQVFTDWIISLNHMMLQKNRRILLLLHRHRIRASGNIELSNVKLIFFPANFPPHLRPLRRDVFLSAKMNYRLTYAEKIRQPDTKWEVEEMITAILKSWNDVPRELIISSFQRTTFRSDDKLLEISNDDWEKLNTGINLKTLITFDDHLSDVPNSVSNDANQIIKEKHKYNLRTSNHEVFPVDEIEDMSKLKNNFQKQSLKTESLAKTVPQDSIEDDNINLDQANNSHQEINCAMALGREENSDNLLEENILKELEENISQDLEENISTDLEENISRDLEENVSKDFEENISKDLEEDISTDLGENISKDFEENISKDLEENISKDFEENILKDFEENISKDLDENISQNLEENISKDLEENISKDLEENISKDSEKNIEDVLDNLEKISNFCPVGVFTAMNKDAIALVMGEEINLELIMKPKDMLMSSLDENPGNLEENDCHQTRENSDNIYDDYNQPSTSEKRSRLPSLNDQDEPPEKIQKTESNWCKNYENKFYFGSNSQTCPGPSTQNDDHNIDLGNRVSNSTQTEIKNNKLSGAYFLFTKTGTRTPRSSKD